MRWHFRALSLKWRVTTNTKQTGQILAYLAYLGYDVPLQRGSVWENLPGESYVPLQPDKRHCFDPQRTMNGGDAKI